jgi:hypothetical protein
MCLQTLDWHEGCDDRGRVRQGGFFGSHTWGGDKGKRMLRKIGRLFLIKNRFEAFAVIYALALGAVERGQAYLVRFPGFGGKLLFLATTCAVFMAGAKILDCLKFEQARAANEPATPEPPA